MLRAWGVRRGGRVQPWPVWVAEAVRRRRACPSCLVPLDGWPVSGSGSASWPSRSRRRLMGACSGDVLFRAGYQHGAMSRPRGSGSGWARRYSIDVWREGSGGGLVRQAPAVGRRAPLVERGVAHPARCAAHHREGASRPPVECAVAIVPSPVVLACHGGLAVALCSPLGWGCQIWTLCEVTPRGAFSLTTP